MEVLLVDGLNNNLLIISQSCEKGNNVTFDSSGFLVIKSKLNQTIFITQVGGNTYNMNLYKFPSNDVF